MNRRIVSAIAILLCIYLDSVLFPVVNVLRIRPDAMLAATVSVSILLGPGFGAVFGGFGGLLLDMMANRYVGFSGALLIVAALASGIFYQKYYADNIIVPAASALALAFLKEHMMALVLMVSGARFPYVTMLLQYILPGALMTALLCALLHLVLKPLMARQLKRSRVEKLAQS